MPAPTTWSAPASGGTVAEDSPTVNDITYAGGYWFSITRNSIDWIQLRYATDPAGAWEEATLPGPPVEHADMQTPGDSGVIYGDGIWAFHMRYLNISGGDEYCLIVYTSDPTASWSVFEYFDQGVYFGSSLAYADGTWVVTGQCRSSSPFSGFIGTCSTIDGTYSFDTSSSIGWDASVATDIRGIAHDGTNWITYASRAGGADEVNYSTSLSSGWSAATIATVSGASLYRLRVQPSGYLTIQQYASGDTTNNGVFYAASPSSWTLLAADPEGHDTAYGAFLAQSSGYWVLLGTDGSVPLLSYYASTGGPSAGFTAIADPFDPSAGASFGLGIAGNGTHLVAGCGYYGDLRYCLLSTPTAPTYLRQRQSPRSSPTRNSLRGYDLRQRQRFVH